MTATADLTSSDYWGHFMARVGIARMRYTVCPGLYAIGDPDEQSDVLVTANYRMTFNKLRCQLAGRDVWILVLDTKGINVWCAAGKGTFGTEEIVNRIKVVGLDKIVTHRRLILPQLAAPGVAAHKVCEHTGFYVIYGPVYARDLPAFLDNDLKATQCMRRVLFPLRERAALASLEVGMWFLHYLTAAVVVCLLSGLNRDGYSFSLVLQKGLPAALIIMSMYVLASILGPATLTLYPGPGLSVKGLLLGVDLFIVLILLNLFWLQLPFSLLGWTGLGMLLLTVSSVVVMNFTGSTTYTSLSGVIKEMKIAIPIQISSFLFGLILWIVSLFL
jgi:acetyl-CoA decarbonylase/synthase complex subunit gamma